MAIFDDLGNCIECALAVSQHGLCPRCDVGIINQAESFLSEAIAFGADPSYAKRCAETFLEQLNLGRTETYAENYAVQIQDGYSEKHAQAVAEAAEKFLARGHDGYEAYALGIAEVERVPQGIALSIAELHWRISPAATLTAAATPVE